MQKWTSAIAKKKQVIFSFIALYEHPNRSYPAHEAVAMLTDLMKTWPY